MLISGRATFRVSFQELASTAVTVPGFVLPTVFSNSVSIQTSPIPFCAGEGRRQRGWFRSALRACSSVHDRARRKSDGDAGRIVDRQVIDGSWRHCDPDSSSGW
jgi:hypothetical protein